ncbi:ARM repeat-containing protein [Rhodofomes roseus]|uniref:ARM repeat-containing protein n=1 Tax=Rhodofomes roseus TaxID=34475 RepID=A0ABQ8K8I1_9APHY|nr:ARM repeat-containing protein [Rhodofomes roseus]KAH9833385.1 ARM repeat-containing protein [Rhodofomes roseus]
MEAIVPPEVTAELTQILSNLVLGDNQIRSNAEKIVDDRLSQTPELYILALAQFSTQADTEVMRSFSLVLLRRLLFRATSQSRLPLYDHLSSQSVATLERILLYSLLHEPASVVRHKAVDTVADLANQAMARGRPWHALQTQAFRMVEAGDVVTREAAFRVFAGSVNLIIDLQTEAIVGMLQKGLQDPESIEVRLAALRASVAFLAASDKAQQAQALALLYPMLSTLPALPHKHLPAFLTTLTPLASSDPALFEQHLRDLLAFLPPLIVPAVDAGPTPTVARPNPGAGGSFVFPPPVQNGQNGSGAGASGKGKAPEERDVDEEAEEVRKAALEFMISLSEARPGMVRRVDGWTAVVVRGCLEGMGEIPEDETEVWLEADPGEDPTDDTYPHVYEQSVDRLACALGGKAVLPSAFQYIPAMLASHDWRLRHAGLMAIAAIAEGTSKVMQEELGKVVELILPGFTDLHPRVRYAACQCIGQLCTDLEEVIQEQYHQQIFNALIPTLEAPEARVHAHAAAALINFCEGVERDTLIPYLDPIVERLLKLLNPASGSPKRYVQEQVITTLAMVADASEATFAKHYSSIMPLLLNILQNANGPDYRKLRAKAMECAGLIAIAVGRDVFRPDANTFVELLMRIQNSPPDLQDTMLTHYLIATWAKVCQAMGEEFEPYLPVVMSPLLAAAGTKTEVSVYEDAGDEPEDREGWEVMNMDGQHIGIRTSALEEKCQAFETLLIYSSTLGPRFVSYLTPTLELVLPNLRFFFHEGVREACALLVPVLFSCGKNSGALTSQIVSATLSQLITCIANEPDASFLASLYRAFSDSMRLLGGPSALPSELSDGVMEATKRQLQSLADKRKARAARPANQIEEEREDLTLIEEMEEFALEDMHKLLVAFDPNHPLLVAISSVRDLGLHLAQGDGEDEEWTEG